MVFEMLLGERREIPFTLTAKNDVSISTPTYEIKKGATIVESGTAGITTDGYVIYFEPTSTGSFYLNITFVAGYQKLIKQLPIIVKTREGE